MTISEALEQISLLLTDTPFEQLPESHKGQLAEILIAVEGTAWQRGFDFADD